MPTKTYTLSLTSEKDAERFAEILASIKGELNQGDGERGFPAYFRLMRDLESQLAAQGLNVKAAQGWTEKVGEYSLCADEPSTESQ
jgi:vacuolar-type H+-ATPase catalytic subunit A/Vma1